VSSVESPSTHLLTVEPQPDVGTPRFRLQRMLNHGSPLHMLQYLVNNRTAIIVGASSGVGAATARLLAARGFQLALIARREDRLRALAASLSSAAAHPADIGNADEVQHAIERSLQTLGSVDVLVNTAGTNVPDRRLEQLSVADWNAILATNLSGAFYLVRAILPAMRAQGHGLIIHVSSIAGARPSVLSGAAYSASKAGLNALNACTNLEEGPHGIRSCVILSGDIDTELLDRRAEPPPAEARATMLTAEDVASLIADVIAAPDRALIEEIVVRPSH